jgi:ATPase subunit of ABC transporter with duplicated ATPase domains
MLRIENIVFSVEGRPLFAGASATILAGHKVGLVGRNGAGKTTLFRLIRGELALEGGSIARPPRTRIGGVAQEVPSSDTTLLDTVMAADTERAALMAEAETATEAGRIAEIQTRLADIDAWSAEGRATALLRGLGFTEAEVRMPCRAFSGGWRMRVALAGVLFAQPDLLLLDEPTNYLDLEGALWLEAYLARYPHTVIVISHDRGLLNRAVDHILHLEDRPLSYYTGGYDTFAETRAAQRAVQAAEAKKQAARRACTTRNRLLSTPRTLVMNEGRPGGRSLGTTPAEGVSQHHAALAAPGARGDGDRGVPGVVREFQHRSDPRRLGRAADGDDVQPDARGVHARSERRVVGADGRNAGSHRHPGAGAGRPG